MSFLKTYGSMSLLFSSSLNKVSSRNVKSKTVETDYDGFIADIDESLKDYNNWRTYVDDIRAEISTRRLAQEERMVESVYFELGSDGRPRRLTVEELEAGGHASFRAMDQFVDEHETMISEEELLNDLVGYLDAEADTMKSKRVLMTVSDDDLVNELNRRGLATNANERKQIFDEDESGRRRLGATPVTAVEAANEIRSIGYGSIYLWIYDFDEHKFKEMELAICKKGEKAEYIQGRFRTPDPNAAVGYGDERFSNNWYRYILTYLITDPRRAKWEPEDLKFYKKQPKPEAAKQDEEDKLVGITERLTEEEIKGMMEPVYGKDEAEVRWSEVWRASELNHKK